MGRIRIVTAPDQGDAGVIETPELATTPPLAFCSAGFQRAHTQPFSMLRLEESVSWSTRSYHRPFSDRFMYDSWNFGFVLEDGTFDSGIELAV